MDDSTRSRIRHIFLSPRPNFVLMTAAVIEEALGDDAATVLPDVLRLAELRARIPRYQRDMLHVLAEWQGTTVDEVLTRELEGVASAYAGELAGAVPDFGLAMRWPLRGAERAG